MELSEDEIIEKDAKQCKHCLRNTLLPYEKEFTCVSCGYNVLKRKQELSKTSGKKIDFNNRLKNAEHKMFCICRDVYKIYEVKVYDKTYEVRSKIKNKKIKMNNILIKKN